MTSDILKAPGGDCFSSFVRRAAIGSGPVTPPWWEYGEIKYGDCRTVALCSDAQAEVPTGYAEVDKSQKLPVSEHELESLRRDLAQGGWFEVERIPDEQAKDMARERRGDPSEDWYAWVVPDGTRRLDAQRIWVETVDGAITSRHNHISIHPCQGGWNAWLGLGHLMDPVRGGGSRSGRRFDTQEAAREAALREILRLREQALCALQEKLRGWSEAAVVARLSPSPTEKLLSGWTGLDNGIKIHYGNTIDTVYPLGP